jgi:hypothetical protein
MRVTVRQRWADGHDGARQVHVKSCAVCQDSGAALKGSNELAKWPQDLADKVQMLQQHKLRVHEVGRSWAYSDTLIMLRIRKLHNGKASSQLTQSDVLSSKGAGACPPSYSADTGRQAKNGAPVRISCP